MALSSHRLLAKVILEDFCLSPPTVQSAKMRAGGGGEQSSVGGTVTSGFHSLCCARKDVVSGM